MSVDNQQTTPAYRVSPDVQAVTRAQALTEGIMVLARYVIVALLPVIGWLFSEVMDLRQNQAVMVANAFTTLNAVELQAEFSVQLNTTAARLEDLRREVATLPRENPPQWFVARVEKLEDNYTHYDNKMDSMSELLIRIDAQVTNLSNDLEHLQEAK